MAGKFEAFVDQDSFFRFRLLAPDGSVMAVSGPFEDKAALAAGITAVRECAGTGLVTDLCPAGAVARPAPAGAPVFAPAAAPADCEDRRTPAGHTFVLAKGPRRQGTKPRWTTAVAR
ncbi:YegP family protein [Arthrobacter sp. ZGTC412]|uniref:YegP family protein n=1 Tax=Arthrobacter sp. ZGTC412 TaxID=2058900 RepID=UPI000CE33793|nr:YegP family protein [Arthrobacter sp. ZGTC412]